LDRLLRALKGRERASFATSRGARRPVDQDDRALDAAELAATLGVMERIMHGR